MKRLFLILIFLSTFANANIIGDKLLLLNGFDYNTLEVQKYINTINDSLNYININSSVTIPTENQQIRDLLDMLKLIAKSLAVVSILLILLLIYFVYDYMKFKNKTLKNLKTTKKELETTKKELENSTIKDCLTGLLNKKYFEDIFNIQYSISIREETYLSFFILEIDNFEKFCQNKTQIEIDNTMNKISNLVKLHFKRATDLIFRLEDGIFAGIILSKEESEPKIQLEKLIDKIKETKDNITVSIGFTTNHKNEKLSKESIYTMTNHALLKAKENKHSTVLKFDDILK